jgi:hypothetical protein
MSGKKMRYFWTALAAAWAVDILFWGKSIGVSFPIWIFLVLTAIFGLAISERQIPPPASWVLSFITMASAIAVFIRREPLTMVVNALLSLGILILLTMTFRNGNWTRYRIPDYFISFIRLVGAAFSRPPSLFKQTPTSEYDNKTENPLKIILRQSTPVLRGLLLALPVVAILAALLASADLVFQDRLADFLKFIDLAKIPEYLFRLFYVVFILGYIFSGILLHSILPQQVERQYNNKSLFKPFLGWTESAIVLASVNLMFAIFVAIQFRYLFGGQANITAAGYTYAEYARRGFGELVSVALLSLLLYLTLSAVTHQRTTHQKWGFTILSSTLMGLVLIMLASAFQRLYLYESVYGFTRMRTYPHVFIIWLAVLLIAAIALEIFRRKQRFILALLLSIFGFCLTLGVLNVDGFIIKQNVHQRIQTNSELDAAYLKELSTDAVPEMIHQYSRLDIPMDVKDILGAELSCRTAETIELYNEPQQVFSNHLSRSTALRSLMAHQATWVLHYPIQKDHGEWQVVVNEIPQACSPYDFYLD